MHKTKKYKIKAKLNFIFWQSKSAIKSKSKFDFKSDSSLGRIIIIV